MTSGGPLHRPLVAAETAAGRQARRSIQVLRLVVAMTFGVVGFTIAARGYANWFVMAAAGAVVAIDASNRMAAPNPNARRGAGALDITAIGAACLASGLSPMATAIPIAYAAAGVIYGGGLSMRRFGFLFYGGAWSAILAIAAASSEFRPQTPSGTLVALIAQAGFLLVVGATVILHSRLMRLVERYRVEAAEANDTKTEFLRNISHEMRTPMNGILGMADLLLESELARDHIEQVSTIRTSGFDLLSLINDLLDLSWIEADEVEIESIPFAPRDALGSLLETFQPLAQDKNLDLEMHVASSVPDFVLGDPGRFRQVVGALVRNAIEYTNEGGVWVRVAGTENRSGHQLRVAVADTGIGMSEDQAAGVYSLFSQSDGSLTRQHGGTGIGLAIASRLVILMGGTMQVESEEGVGSNFHFSIPIKAGGHAESADNAGMPDSTPRVLFVAGENGVSDRLTSALRDAGFRLDTSMTMTGILDGPLPEVDAIVFDVGEGLRAIQKVREIHPESAPLVFITSGGQRGDSGLARKLAVAAYLSRPVSSDDVVAAVRSVVNRQSDGGEASLITVHSLREARSRVRVLIAEDSPTNRAIASLALKRRGYVITEVADGSHALHEWQQGDHDVILMDIQMPVMDGLEATRRIRELERTLGTHTPIIALTAHALREDREKALEAGIDAYLTKPLRIDAVISAIDEHMSGPAERKTSVRQATFDRNALVSQMDGDEELAAEVVSLFRQAVPVHRAEVESALETRNVERVKKRAHQMKGELGGLCAPAAYRLAVDLDSAADTGDWDRITSLWADLDKELGLVDAELALLGT
ncbi:MAG: response regulator [Acidimicrobiia bacterium]|nr:response regulator [Acidimicrobiia bacterium]